MCAIFGCLAWGLSALHVERACSMLDHIMLASSARGRDGWGYHVHDERLSGSGYNFERRSTLRNVIELKNDFFDTLQPIYQGVVIGNMRAEPTTEYVERKHEYDQQPYRFNGWNIVHNGTIANDKDLRDHSLPTNIDSAAIAELLGQRDKFTNLSEAAIWFDQCIRKLKGSYAILATHDSYSGAVFVACNYRPIWYIQAERSFFFASSRDYFPDGFSPQMIEPYSAWLFTPDKRTKLDSAPTTAQKALVVCSGGMDSVVAAKALQAEGCDVHLLHFQYGSRAQEPEYAAIHACAAAMRMPLHILPMAIYDKQDSPLLQEDSEIAGGEEGAEFAHEWVPARNLVMLSLATAYAEAKGFDLIGLGNNLEEAGAYPDNEPEFINRFNDLLPFAVGDGRRLRVVMPVGNLMKHEIVALGEKLGAPMGQTWSCYRSGLYHCGTCGPCFMRKTAYEINDLEDPIQYRKDA